MTEGFRSSPPPSPEVPAAAPDPYRYRQEVTETVQRVMGDGIAPPEDSPVDSPQVATTEGQDESSTTDVAKDQAAQVADTAKQAGTQVAGTVKDQAGQLTAEAGRQAKQLLSQARSEVTEQAAATAPGSHLTSRRSGRTVLACALD